MPQTVKVRQRCHSIRVSTNPLIVLLCWLLQFPGMNEKNDKKPFFSRADRRVFGFALALSVCVFVALSSSILTSLLQQ